MKALDIRRLDRVVFIHREILWAAILLARGGVHNPDFRVIAVAAFGNGKLRPHVDVEIGEGIDHAVGVADLPGQVEQVFLPGTPLAEIKDTDSTWIG